ncbi:unnamed protein product [Linum trigynum]|uniref:S-protein homolog n=1 Tax=Linum trigynum TaxID=586398 RepID=A0AAV2GX94_9ROSI
MVVIASRRSVLATRVQVSNQLSSKILIAHCRSKDDDLGARVIIVGKDTGWSFEADISGVTLFWCNLAVEDKRLSFTAFDGDMYGDQFWDVRDDGVYGTTKFTNARYLEREWRRIQRLN